MSPAEFGHDEWLAACEFNARIERVFSRPGALREMREGARVSAPDWRRPETELTHAAAMRALLIDLNSRTGGSRGQRLYQQGWLRYLLTGHEVGANCLELLTAEERAKMGATDAQFDCCTIGVGDRVRLTANSASWMAAAPYERDRVWVVSNIRLMRRTWDAREAWVYLGADGLMAFFGDLLLADRAAT